MPKSANDKTIEIQDFWAKMLRHDVMIETKAPHQKSPDQFIFL